MWINIYRHNGLGNSLFARSQVYAAALEYDETVIDFGFIKFRNYFPNSACTELPIYPLESNGSHKKIPSDVILNKLSLRLIHFFRPKFTGEFANFWSQYYLKGDTEKVRLDSKGFIKFKNKYNNIFLNGHKLRCPELVKKHRTKICQYFQFPNSYMNKWNFLIKNFKNKYSEVIGLHMRRGDFKWAIRGEYFLTPSEYASILKNKVEADFKNTLIIIFSEDKFLNLEEWEDIKSCFSFTNFILNNGTELDDLCGLMFCDRIVGPTVSTFSRWSAFAGNKYWAGLGRKTLEDSNNLAFKKCPIPWDYQI